MRTTIWAVRVGFCWGKGRGGGMVRIGGGGGLHIQVVGGGALPAAWGAAGVRRWRGREVCACVLVCDAGKEGTT